MVEKKDKPSIPEELKTPLIGDVVSTEHIPSGVVLSKRVGVLNVSAITELEDGPEILNAPGTQSMSQLIEITGHWGAARICAAWFRQFEGIGIDINDKQKQDFFDEMKQRMENDPDR